MKGLIAALGLGALAAAGALWAGRAALAPALAALQGWQVSVQSAPEGPVTGAVFDTAVAGGAIVWDPATGQVTLRRERAEALPPAQADALLRLGEASVAISAELDRLAGLDTYAAIRARCSGLCDAPQWQLSLAGEAGIPAQARAAAHIRSDLPSPLPRTHFALADTAAGWSDWLALSAAAPVMISAGLEGFDALEVVGGLDPVPEGWRVVARWCRGARGELGACTGAAPVAATRLERTGGAAALQITPLPVAPEDGSGFALSDRVRVACTDTCRPEWVAAANRRSYARAPDEPATGSAPLIASSGFLDPWALIEDGALVPSPMAYRLGALPVIGDGPDAAGSLIAAAAGLPAGTPARVTLDPTIQEAAQGVLAAMVTPGTSDPFADVPRHFAPEGPQAALVVIDLRDSLRPGAIRAAVGLPSAPAGRSRWGLAAAAHDPAGRFAPGAAGWTGRRWHQIPGSAWKLFSALAMIEALESGLSSASEAADLQRVLAGITRAEADSLLGPAALSGARGLCIPRDLSTRPQGAEGPECPAEFYPRPVADSGRAGPLAGDDTARTGLVEAVARSSNVWFAAATLRSEATASRSPAGILAQRLGFDRPAPLDAGLGLDLLPRDAAQIDALGPSVPPGHHARAIASGAFGQQVQAGPLILAQLAASVRLNRVLHPSLIDPPAPAAALYTLPHSVQLLDQLRDGMRAVTAPDRQGTARAVFARHAPGLQGRTGGKTGTAERGVGEDRISTFAGWLDAPDGRPAFAIGCAITLRGMDRAEAGLEVPPLCAHMVALLMTRLDAAVLR